MLVPTMSNWLDLLRASELVNSPRLKLSVYSFLRDNFTALHLDREQFIDVDDNLTDNEFNDLSIQALKEEFPTLLEDILFARSEYFPMAPSKGLIQQTVESKEITAKAGEKRFPVWVLGLAAICLFLYQHVTTIVPMGMFIPIMNVGGMIGCLYLLYRHIILG